MKKNLLPLFTLLLFSTLSFAQNYRTIRGKVYDKQTKQPVAYAHVGILEKGIGTTTSDNGIFVFKIPEKYYNSTLMVSFIGYKTYKKSISEIQSPVRIHIEQASNELTEVVVMADAAVEDIIRKAVKNIPNNYPTHATTALGFYRESRTDDSLNFIYLAEGVLNIFKKSYKSKKEGQVSLIQGRLINLNNPLDTTVYSRFSSGHMAAHRFDFVKNRVDFIDERFFPVYKYWIESITFYNDKKVFIIGFEKDEGVDPVQGEVDDEFADDGGSYSLILKSLGKKKKKKKIKARMKGRIFIEQESYAFLRAEFEITKDGLKKYNDYPLYAGSWNGNSYVVNYRKLGDKWYFSDALREGVYGGGGLYNNEIKITEINTEKSGPLPYNDRLRRGEKFTKVTGEYDEDFWKSYNTTPLTEGLAESVQQLETIKKAQEAFDAAYMAELREKRDSIQEIETKKIQTQLAEKYDIDESVLFEYDLPTLPKKKKKKDYAGLNVMIGLGSHFIKTDGAQMGVTYLPDNGESHDTILSVNEYMKPREFEVFWHADFDISINKNLFARLGVSGDFYNSIYKERSVGFGARVNLSKQRPFFLKATASFSNFRYARKIGEAENNFGKFKANKKKFNADYINVYYGSRTNIVKLAGELSLELNPGRELYVRAAYFLPFSRRQDIWLRENAQLFRKKRHIPVNDAQVKVNYNGEPFNGQIMPEQTLSITVGVLFK